MNKLGSALELFWVLLQKLTVMCVTKLGFGDAILNSAVKNQSDFWGHIQMGHIQMGQY